ncbi:hypothetical protein [Geothrix sp. 21YS21S-2]|uniref:hypothetical protein n=1 Tax=Geothrix sp. 21YS21S-2 TaxID=3068893 RepID=UPI0027B9A494|nr:hypothetical protein [Geothrix sp. 21YS21S-2]
MPIFHPQPPQIPAHLHGKRKVLEAFRTLPAETRVFVGVNLPDPETPHGQYLAFLVADAELGLVIVNVPAEGVEPRKGHWVRRNADGTYDPLEKSPADVLQAQQNALFKFLKGLGLAFIPRMTQVLALPSLQLEPGRALGPNLPACRLLTEEKLRNPYISLRMAVTGGKTWTEWCTTPLAGQFAIGRETMERLAGALGKP